MVDDINLSPTEIDSLKESLETNSKKLETGCWIYPFNADVKKYPSISIRGKRWKLSRLSYVLYYSAFDSCLFVLHICDTPACINPIHLRVGTQKQNMSDCAKKNRLNHSGSIYKIITTTHANNQKPTANNSVPTPIRANLKAS